ncbi:hypothetical protein [Lacihabitans soyangensis]|uniref:hypothetical protein n=1 Tax=Lacihabitans soyangensis TaxID=869394 RepID=UPI0020CF3619|nr:hypothetical protein [Lacihabitans soyangensis]
MSQRPSVSVSCSLASCPCSSVPASEFVQLTPYAYQRFVRRVHFASAPRAGVRVYHVPCGCYLWVHATGQRFLSALPF